MDDPYRHRLAIRNHTTRLLAIPLVLALAGCKQLGIGQSKTDNPVVPPPPDRKVPVDSQTSSAKPATPVKLDGSAMGDGAPGIPNTPLIAAAPVMAGPGTASNSAADDVARLRAATNGASGKTNDAAQPGSPSDQIDESDEPPTLDVPANDRPNEAPTFTKSGAQTKKGGQSKAGSWSKTGATVDASTNPMAESAVKPGPEAKTEPPSDDAGAEKPDKIIQVGDLDAGGDAPKIDLLKDATTDVVTPLEIEGDGAAFVKGKVAATVNGVPIFCDDVLRGIPDEYARNLAQIERGAVEGKVPPEEFRKYRRQVIEHFLKEHIQQELLLQALKLRLRPEQMHGLTKQLDKIFDTEDLPLAMKKAEVSTAAELEQKLAAQGSSIESLRVNSRNRQLAQQYLGKEAALNIGYDRPDIRKYYEEHKQNYFVVAEAKWEQIQLKFVKNGGKEGALKKAEEVRKRLDDGEVFAVVAEKCSNGPTAANGGLWPRTKPGSIKSKEIDTALFEMPVGEISGPIETETSIDIIRVIDRSPAHYQLFEDVQEDIKNQLKMSLFQERVNKLLKDLKDKASIEDFTDKL